MCIFGSLVHALKFPKVKQCFPPCGQMHKYMFVLESRNVGLQELVAFILT